MVRLVVQAATNTRRARTLRSLSRARQEGRHAHETYKYYFFPRSSTPFLSIIGLFLILMNTYVLLRSAHGSRALFLAEELASNWELNINETRRSIGWNTTTILKPWVVFYHIYIPLDDEFNRQRGLAIVSEQIKDIGRSYVGGGESMSSKNRTIVYYSTVGGSLEDDWMALLCDQNKLDCREMGHFESGHETLTLDQARNFCTAHPDKIVSYVHTKGSFHPEGAGAPGNQDRWRRHMTAAATSEECARSLEASNSTCNTCGLLFSPFPSEHFPGNAWVAKCSYVKDLLPSAELSEKRQVLLNTLRAEGFWARLFPTSTAFVGTDRYMSEHWVGSSPRISPCDVSKELKIEYWQEADRNTSLEFDLSMAPRFSFDQSLGVWAVDFEILQKPHKRMREYFLLPGHLHRWIKEYNATPPSESWVWTWFLDSQRWKTRVMKEGTNAVSNFIKNSPKRITTNKTISLN